MILKDPNFRLNRLRRFPPRAKGTLMCAHAHLPEDPDSHRHPRALRDIVGFNAFAVKFARPGTSSPRLMLHVPLVASPPGFGYRPSRASASRIKPQIPAAGPAGCSADSKLGSCHAHQQRVSRSMGAAARHQVVTGIVTGEKASKNPRSGCTSGE